MSHVIMVAVIFSYKKKNNFRNINYNDDVTLVLFKYALSFNSIELLFMQICFEVFFYCSIFTVYVK